MEATAETANSASDGASAAAGSVVVIFMSSGISSIEPVMTLFMVLKVISRLKLINIEYGDIQEIFLGSMGGAF